MPRWLGHQDQDHRRQLHLPHRRRLHPRRRQQRGEHVQPLARHRIGDQGLAGEILRRHERLRRQRMGRGRDEARLVVEQRREGDPVQVLRVGGDHQVHLLALQRRQRPEGEARADVHVDLRPGPSELLQHREQPLEAGMALDGDMQPPRPPRDEAGELRLQRRHLRQDPLGGAQQLHPRRRQLHRFRPAHEQLHPGLVLQVLHLVAQRRLGDVQPVRRPRQSALVVDRLDRAQVAELDMHLPRNS